MTAPRRRWTAFCTLVGCILGLLLVYRIMGSIDTRPELEHKMIWPFAVYLVIGFAVLAFGTCLILGYVIGRIADEANSTRKVQIGMETPPDSPAATLADRQ
jgi:hypothetical protein